MLKVLKQLLTNRLDRLRATDFGDLDILKDAEERNREAHDKLLHELREFSTQLHEGDRRVAQRRWNDKHG